MRRLVPPRGSRTFYGGKLVTEEGVEVPDREVESFLQYGWSLADKPKKKKPTKKAKAEEAEE